MRNLLTKLKTNLLKYFNVVCNNSTRNRYLNNLTMEEKNELDNLKEKYIVTFNEFVKKGENPWKTPEELSTATGTTVTQVTKVINTFDDFVQNSNGELLTRKKYEELTPTWKKIIHSLRHKI